MRTIVLIFLMLLSLLYSIPSNAQTCWSVQQGPPGPTIGGPAFGSPSLAVFNGQLYAAWRARDDQTMYWSSTRDGVTWTTQRQGIGGGSATGPSLAVFNGRLYAAWRGISGSPPDQTMYWSSTLDGVTWTTQRQGIGGGSSQGPQLAVFKDQLYAAWRGANNDQTMWWSSTRDGVTWTTQRQGIGGGSSQGPSLAVFNGRLYAAWKGAAPDQTMWWSSTVDGLNWTIQQQGIGGGTTTRPSLAVFNGRLFAAWKGISGVTNDTRMFWSSTVDGQAWATQQVGIGGGSSTGPSLAVFNGRLFAAGRASLAIQGCSGRACRPRTAGSGSGSLQVRLRPRVRLI